MSVYRINQVGWNMVQRLGLQEEGERTNFPSKQEAIDTLKAKFDAVNQDYVIKETDVATLFMPKHGVKPLAQIIEIFPN